MKLLGDRSVASLLEGFLTFFWVVAWFVAVAFVVLPIFLSDRSAFSFTVPIRHGLVQETQGSDGTWTLTTAVAQVSTPPGRGWLGSFIAVPFMVLLAYVLGELRAVFRSLREGSPFVASNARRLRRIGLAVLVFEGLRTAVMIAVVGPALERLHPVHGGARIQADTWPSWLVLFLGFAILVLAEVFRRGTQMQDEQALTV